MGSKSVEAKPLVADTLLAAPSVSVPASFDDSAVVGTAGVAVAEGPASELVADPTVSHSSMFIAASEAGPAMEEGPAICKYHTIDTLNPHIL